MQERRGNPPPEVVIIGAGPIGLLTAIQLKTIRPELDVIVLEKRDRYIRNHVLTLQPTSFHGMPKALNDQIKRWIGPHVTCELETELRASAQEIGVKLVQAQLVAHHTPCEGKEEKKPHIPSFTCEELREHYPRAKYFISAEGSHSIVHQDKFLSGYQQKKSLGYLAELKYDVIGHPPALTFFRQSSLFTRTKHFVLEEISKEKKGISTVTLRAFIDAETYQSMQQANLSHPLTLSSATLPQSLRETMRSWMLARRSSTKEVVINDTDRMTAIDLPMYASRKYIAKDSDGTPWILVGDAAFCVPFYRSVNNGIVSSVKLVRAITSEMGLDLRADRVNLDQYAHSTQSLWKREALRAQVTGTSANVMLAVSKAITPGICRAFTRLANAFANLFKTTPHRENAIPSNGSIKEKLKDSLEEHVKSRQTEYKHHVYKTKIPTEISATHKLIKMLELNNTDRYESKKNIIKPTVTFIDSELAALEHGQLSKLIKPSIGLFANSLQEQLDEYHNREEAHAFAHGIRT